MPSLEIIQTRQISTSGESSSACFPYPQTPPSWTLPNALRRSAHRGVEFLAPCEGKSVIHLEIHSRRPNGATHRKKVDTPPLKGYCRGTLVPSCERSET